MGRLIFLSIVASISFALLFFVAPARSDTAIDAGSLVATPHGSRQWYLEFNTPSPFRDALRITNSGEEPSSFELRWNGGIFYRQSQIVAEIAQLPDEYHGEPLHIKAFRYVRDRRAWWESFATGNWYSHPLVNLNGWGANVCGVDSRMFALLLHNMGYQTRTTWYPHHGVSSVMIDGRWQMFDVTYGAYFMDDLGNIVDETYLSAGSVPILAPSNAMVGFDFSRGRFSDHAHHPEYARVLRDEQYIGQAPVFNSPESPPALSGPLSFSLPEKASLTLPVALATEAATNVEGYPVIGSAPVFAGARVLVPAGSSGMVGAPLILVSVDGAGVFEIDGRKYDTEALNQHLGRFDAFNHEVLVEEARTDLVFSYSLNPKILSFSQSTRSSFAALMVQR